MLKQIFSTIGTRFLVAAANFAIILILSQQLHASGKGEASLILATIAIILVFSNIIGGATLVYLIPRKSFSTTIVSSYLWSALISSLAYITLHFLKDPFALEISILSFLNSVLSIHLTALIAKEKIGQNNILSFIQHYSSLIYLIAILFFYNSLSLSNYVESLFLAYGLVSVLSFIAIAKYFDSFKGDFFDVFKDAFYYGFQNQLAHLLTIINLRISYFILNEKIDSAAVGIYSNAISLIESTWIVSRSVAMVQFSKIANTDDLKENQTLTNKLSKLSIVLSVGIILPMSILPSSFYEFFFGRDFGDINTLILIMSPSIILYNYYLIMGHYYSGIGNYMISIKATGAGLVSTILFTYPLINYYGLNGASLATSFSILLSTLVVLFQFKKDSKLSWKDFTIKRSDLLQ